MFPSLVPSECGQGLGGPGKLPRRLSRDNKFKKIQIHRLDVWFKVRYNVLGGMGNVVVKGINLYVHLWNPGSPGHMVGVACRSNPENLSPPPGLRFFGTLLLERLS